MKKDIDTLDKVFSEYIRLRDSDQYGMIHCISCGKRVAWKQADAGHYISRSHMNLRFDEKNINAQCRECNRFKSANIENYKRGLIQKYGQLAIHYLENKKHEIRQFSDFEINILILHYRKKIRQLKANV